MLRTTLVSLLLFGACASPIPPAESTPMELLLERVSQGRPLIAGGHVAVQDPTCLVRPLGEKQLDRLLELGHERGLIQALFAPGAGDHPAHAKLLDGLRKLQSRDSSPARAELIESLSLPFAWRRAEDLSASGSAGQVQVSVSHWDVPLVSLASTLRNTGGLAQGPTRALLEAALQLLDH